MITLTTELGTVNIYADVISRLVGEAATSCFGVTGMAMRSMTDGLVHILKRESMGKGVYITYKDNSSVSVELHIIVDQDINIPVLCRSIIEQVKYKVSSVLGIQVERVDVFVDSLER